MTCYHRHPSSSPANWWRSVMPKNSRAPRPSPRRRVDAPAHTRTPAAIPIRSKTRPTVTCHAMSLGIVRLVAHPNAALRGAGPSSWRLLGGGDPHRTVAVQSNAGHLSRTSSSSGGEPRPGLPVAGRRSHDAPRRGIPAWRRTQGGTAAEPRDLRFARSRTLVRPAEENWRGNAAAARARSRPDADVRAAVNRMSARDEIQASPGGRSALRPLLHLSQSSSDAATAPFHAKRQGPALKLRAWSGITEWRFESSSAHSETVRSGEHETAWEALDRLAAMTRVSGSDWALGVEARSRALLCTGEAEEDLYREAIERLERAPTCSTRVAGPCRSPWRCARATGPRARDVLRVTSGGVRRAGRRRAADLR
jgi:hypothetical protein